jgi:hypothetical protein
MRRTRRFTIAAALGMGTALAVGCSTEIVAPPPVDEPPAASSPAGAVQRFAWGFNHKDVEVVSGLLSDDFQFISAGTDSAGNPLRTPPYDRSWFLEALAALADSSSTVSFAVDQNLVPFPDSRPGKVSKFHKQVRTWVDGKVRFTDPSRMVEITGSLLFFLTRGDSAAIPQQLIDRGLKPDSTRWWLDRMEDETLGSPVASYSTRPNERITFRGLLEYFHSLVAH